MAYPSNPITSILTPHRTGPKLAPAAQLPNTLTFIGLRTLSPLLQYSILAHNSGAPLLHALGLHTLPAGAPNTHSALDALGLSPYRLILLGMSAGAALKQAVWAAAFNSAYLPPVQSAASSAAAAALDALNALLFTSAAASASLASGARFPQVPLVAGVVVYAVGLGVEVLAEGQRLVWAGGMKKKKTTGASTAATAAGEVEGALCTKGLWSVVRHPNYVGYTLCRAGAALAAGGWIWAGLTALGFGAHFVVQAVPQIEEYMQSKYQTQWAAYKQKTPFAILPYVF